MSRFIIPALVALLVSGPAWGLLGNDLHKWCNGTASPRSDYNKDIAFGNCSGYIMGVFETNGGVNGGVAGYKFCPPKKPDIQQLIDIVRKRPNHQIRAVGWPQSEISSIGGGV